MTEQDAIARLKRGDIGGLETLVAMYQVKAVRTVYLITRDRASAEDIVQAAFVQAYERIEQFESGRQFGPWFMRSIVNRALKVAARSHRQIPLDIDESDVRFANLLADPDVLDTTDLREAVRSALDKLTPEQRAAIVLRYFLGLSEDEMAHELVCPPGTIKWRLHAARKRLRILLRPLWQGGTR